MSLQNVRLVVQPQMAIVPMYTNFNFLFDASSYSTSMILIDYIFLKRREQFLYFATGFYIKEDQGYYYCAFFNVFLFNVKYGHQQFWRSKVRLFDVLVVGTLKQCFTSNTDNFVDLLRRSFDNVKIMLTKLLHKLKSDIMFHFVMQNQICRLIFSTI